MSKTKIPLPKKIKKNTKKMPKSKIKLPLPKTVKGNLMQLRNKEFRIKSILEILPHKIYDADVVVVTDKGKYSTDNKRIVGQIKYLMNTYYGPPWKVKLVQTNGVWGLKYIPPK